MRPNFFFTLFFALWLSSFSSAEAWFFTPGSFGGGLTKAGAGAVPLVPVARYKFDEGSGSTAADLYGGGSLTVTGGSFGTGYLSLDGDTGTNEYAGANGTLYTIGNTDFTLVFWVYPNAIGGAQEDLLVIGNGATGNSGDRTLRLYYWEASPRITVNLVDSGTLSKDTNLSFNMDAGTKYMIAITYVKSTNDNCTLKIYAAPFGGAFSTATDTTQKLLRQVNTHEIRSKGAAGGTGAMDNRHYDLSVYNSVLTQTQLDAILAAGSES